FCLIHYDLSTSINDEKIENIKETGADVLATGCPACMMHLNDGLARNNLDNIKVKHTVELLAESLDK
ncbi:MAG: (Fe-S)-binding protein, partial [Bacillota bacterium]